MKKDMRAIGLGLLLAVIGFSYAVATNDNAVNLGADVRAAGSAVDTGDLRFTNALLPAGLDTTYPLAGDQYSPKVYDLGDVVLSEGTNLSSVVRYLTAAGGLPPYEFSSSNLETLDVGLTLATNGLLSGEIASNKVSGSAFLFLAEVEDATGSNPVTGRFRIGLVPIGEFRFVVSSLSNGLLGLSYVGKLETVGGTDPITYSVVAGSVKVGTEVQDSLEDVGLSLGSDGTVYGQPLVAGSVTFTASAVDANEHTAKGRYPATTENQVITITVENNSIVSSSLMTKKCQVKIAGKADKDSMSFDGFVNLVGSGLGDLSGKNFTVRFGGGEVSGTFDAKGGYKTDSSVKTDKVSAKIQSSKGSLKVKLSNSNLGEAVGVDSISGQTKLMAVQVEIEDVVVASELLEFTVKAKAPKYDLTYQLGKNNTAAGGFMILSIKGTDDKAGGDKWKAKFFAAPRKSIDGSGAGLDNVASGNVNIGPSFTEALDTFSKNQFSKKEKTGIKKVKIDSKKFISSMDTNALDADEVGIEQAETSSAAEEDFTFALELTRSSGAGFTGATSKVVAKSKKNWSDAVK